MTDDGELTDFLKTGGAMEGGLGQSALLDRKPSLEIGQFIANVRILEAIGKGGMGDVFRGVDERLDRQVAIKALRPDGRLTASMRMRFLREAKILSRLDHPCICRLFDLVEEGDQPCLILEYVSGQPLDEILGEFDEIRVVSLGAQIAEALAAAHREGVIHRDLKPGNVMLTDDGSIKILDFGIGRLMEDVKSEQGPEDQASDHLPTNAGDTLAGTVIGTPRFMSPEQARGEPVTPASDLFSFGLMLCALSSGRSPFADKEIAPLLIDVAEGNIEIPAGISPPLRQLITELTHPEPRKRPTAEETTRRLRLIKMAPKRRRQRLIGGVLVGLSIIAVIGALVMGKRLGEGRYRCQDFDLHLEGVWDPSRAQALDNAFSNAGADGVSRSLTPILDAYAEDWVSLRSNACASTWVRGELSPEAYDLSIACFDRRLEEFASLITILSEDPEATRNKAAQAAHALTSLQSCLDVHLLSAEVPLPDDPVRRDRVDQLRRQLARLKAQYDTGFYAEGWIGIEELESDITEADHPPLSAEFFYLKGLIAEKGGEMEIADSALENAILFGQAGRHDRIVAQAWVRRVWLHGVILSNFDMAQTAINFARSVIDRIEGDPGLEGALANHRGVIESVRERPKAALSFFLEALALRREAFGQSHPKIASTMNNCSLAMMDLGQEEQALAMAEDAFEMYFDLLGPDHPKVYVALDGMASILRHLGRMDEAAQLQNRAIALAESVYPPGHPEIGVLKSNLAKRLVKNGQPEKAKILARKAIMILTDTVGRESVTTANAWFNLAISAEQVGDWPTVVEAASSASSIYRAKLGGSNRTTIEADMILGGGYLNTNDSKKAVRLLEDILFKAEESFPDEMLTSIIRSRLGRSLIESGSDRRRGNLLLEETLNDLCRREDDEGGRLEEQISEYLSNR